jgi:glycosyltransferase involved in cell wall biosynthesis
MESTRRIQARLVLHVIEVQARRIGGVERQLRELSLCLARAGRTLTVCMPGMPNPDVGRYLEEAGVIVIAEPRIFRRGFNGLRTAYRLFRTLRPEIVHFSFVPGLSLLPWAAKLAGVRKILFTDQSSRPEGFQPRTVTVLKRLVGRAILAPLDHLVSISDYVLRCNLATGYCRAEKQIRIYNSTPAEVSPDAVSAGRGFRARFDFPFDRIVVTQVSWLTPEKGVFDLLRAARLVVDRNPNLHFVLVGDGAAREELESLRSASGLDKHVTLAGLVIDPLAEGVYAATDISCHFARWQEAFGWVIAEAMSQGKPVVGSIAGALPEIVDEDVSGHLVPVGDVACLAERILDLAASAELRLRMGEAARKKAELCFNLTSNTGELVELYGIESKS